ncbi:MAG: hypothetical protein A3G35_15800 [candidate division NC10 bacterium RIFCSPLOWO2_12_FULL_66_18]|nr:MAG: hypothetical protein A3H39_12970 [candidate division NC10 bacterium RIFCSPLOWO2_02_FULL_66_22]OGB98717.1 MAG: hypothetical protein A3G35_15800 [candidate division NC10 bacterium RIFCSPLOWO2_12_FULL_66_18]
MGRSGRWVLVGALALCGIVLIILGIGGLRGLLVVGKVPPDLLSRQVGYTTGSLAVGLTMIVWCLVTGIAWARSVRVETARSKARPAGQGDG